MNLREEILKEHSKAQCTRIVNWVGDSKQRFGQLFALFVSDEYKVAQRASWPISYCVEAHPALIKPHLSKMLANLAKPNLHDAVRRNAVRLLYFADVPEKFQGEVMNLCFASLENPTEAVATKAYALYVLGNLAKLYPDIIPEIKLLIEDQLPSQTAAFKACAKKVLKQL